MNIARVLIVRADGGMRISSGKRLSLRADEVAFPLRVSIPDTWAKFYRDQAIELQMPGVPSASVEVGKKLRSNSA